MIRNKKVLFALFVVLMAATMLACSITGSGSTGGTKPSMAGKWLDPDTSGTITTIQAQGDGFAVVSVMNPERGTNELTETSWDNGVLTWTYCPPDMYCIVSKTKSVTSDTLTADWYWRDDPSQGGTTAFQRQP